MIKVLIRTQLRNVMGGLKNMERTGGCETQVELGKQFRNS